MKKIALIFGVTGQDGSYLAEFLLSKKYIVHGVKRRSSSLNTERIDHIYQDPHVKKRNFIIHYGDITDSTSVAKIIKNIKPDEIYNLAAQSHVAVSLKFLNIPLTQMLLEHFEYWMQLNSIILRKNKILSSWNIRDVWESSKYSSK